MAHARCPDKNILEPRRDVMRQAKLNPRAIQQTQRHRCGHAASSMVVEGSTLMRGIVGKNAIGFKLFSIQLQLRLGRAVCAAYLLRGTA